MKTFTCESCKKKYMADSVQALERKLKEVKENGFGSDFLKGECVLICHECYVETKTFYNMKPIEEYRR